MNKPDVINALKQMSADHPCCKNELDEAVRLLDNSKFCYAVIGEEPYEDSHIIAIYSDEDGAKERAAKLEKRMDRYNKAIMRFSARSKKEKEAGKFPPSPKHMYQYFDIGEYEIIQ